MFCKVARDVPGIDAAYLAMDTENGVEVVWNEVCYSNRRASRGGHRKVCGSIWTVGVLCVRVFACVCVGVCAV